MHELSIAQSVLDTVEAELKKRPGARLCKVGLRVGELAAVNRDSLEFSWQCLTRETAYEGAGLEIEMTAWRRRCPLCGAVFAVFNYQTLCPQCGAEETEHESGDELDVAFLEMETP